MLIFYIFLPILLLLTSYFFGLPLYKKRPILIKRVGLIIYSFVLIMTLSPLLGLWAYVAAIAVVLFLYLLNMWFVFGVTTTMLSDALQKATLVTRTPVDKPADRYRIDNSMEIRFRSLGRVTNLILFKTINKSKKAELARVVFKKFIQNYFI